MLVVGNGGRQSSGGGAPVTVSPHCLNRAWYELHEVTTELFETKREDERDPNYSDHARTLVRSIHGSGGFGECALTRVQLAQREGGQGTGHGGATGVWP
jgi:hypothetical protein